MSQISVNFGNDLYRGTSSSAPSSPSEGWLYYNTSDGSLYVYTSGAWVAIGGGTPVVSHLLMENGDNFALENGDILTLQ